MKAQAYTLHWTNQKSILNMMGDQNYNLIELA